MKNKSIIISLIVILCIVSVIGYFSYNNYKEKKELASIEVIIKNPSLEEVKKTNDLINNRKISIYLFYGDGCPHCEDLLNHLESIKDEYGKYFTVYAFEVWKNNENGELMDKFAEEFDGEVGSRSVPYYIIGDEVMSGYIPSMSTKVEKKILDKYNERKKIDNYNHLFEK